jgi:hypothetical protein
MNSRLMTVVFSLALALSATVAHGSVTSIMKKMEKQFKVPSKKTKESIMCANFSGTWNGTCTSSDGETLDERVSIRQDNCASFEISGDGYVDTFELNKIERLGTTSFDYMSDFQASGHTEWDIARQVLTVSVIGNYKSLNYGEHGGIEYKKTIAIIDGKLQTRSIQKWENITVPLPNPFSVDCLFTK